MGNGENEMTDLDFIKSLRKFAADPTLFEMNLVFKLIRDGDLIHVDELHDRAPVVAAYTPAFVPVRAK